MRSGKGFSLTELMVGIILGAFVLLALESISASIYRALMGGVHSSRVTGAEAYSLSALTKNLQMTTYISSPISPCPNGACTGPGQPNDTLVGCTNYDPNVPAGGILAPAHSVIAYEFCVDGQGKMWDYFKQFNPSYPAGCPAPITCPLPIIPCGSAPPACVNLVQIAEQVSHDPDPGTVCSTCGHYFRRPAGSASAVELHYQVGLGTAAVVVDTTIQTMKSLESPTP